MELYQLKSFLAVVAERNLTRAAEKVFTSVPAVSAQIKALEEELGVQLFERSSRGMTLTAAGEKLAEEARRTLDAAQRLRQAAAQIRGEVQGWLRMGTVTDPLALRLGEVLVKLAERHPGIGLQLMQRLSLHSVQALRRGEVDCAYVLYDGEAADGLVVERLRRMELAVAVPRRFADREWPVSREALLSLPWIGTQTWLPSPCASANRCRRSSAVRAMKAMSREPQSDSIASRVSGAVVSGPGVSR